METIEASVQKELMKRKLYRDPLGFRWWAMPIEDLYELLEADEEGSYDEEE